MKSAVFILLTGLLAVGLPTLNAQPSGRTTARTTSKPRATPKPTKKPLLSEAEEYKLASEKELAADRITALTSFLENFPAGEKKAEAQELLAGSRILTAEEKLLSGDAAGAAAAYRQAIEETPETAPKEFFNDQLAKIPSTLYFRGARPQAVEIAGVLERKYGTSAPHLLQVADFYLGIEDGAEALRVAKAAEAIAPDSAPVQRAIATANRLNFDLDESAKAFAKAVELDPESVAAKRGLADMQRASGRPEAALPIYRELVEKNDKDPASRTGYILTLFETGKRADAEREMAAALEGNPGNVVLMAGAAYFYAADGNGDKAVELAKKALDRDPRYIWSHIALARGQIAERKPVDAEQTLIKARKYGNFPTLEFELASARLQAGFYREALEELKKSFSVADGKIVTKLGGRVVRSGDDIAELIAGERRASILTPKGAEGPDTAAQLKQLLILDAALQPTQPDEAAVAKAADDFIQSAKTMKVHRQLFAASMLLQKRVAMPKVVEIAASAVDSSEAAFDGPEPAAAVLASELYEPRALAFSRNDFLLVPDVPRQTLSAIIRGRIEETAGWALFQQEKYAEADVRLRRAISVMPDKSAWWRSSVWKLGAVLAAEGKDKEALDSYLQSYKTDKPDYIKYVTIEGLYKKINGSTDGLEALVGPERVVASASFRPMNPEQVRPETAKQETPTRPAGSRETGGQEAVTPAPVKAEPAAAIPKSVPVDAGGSDPHANPPASSETSRNAEIKAASSPEPESSTQKPAATDPKTELVVEKKLEASPPSEQPAEKKTEPLADTPTEKKTETPTDTPTEVRTDVPVEKAVEKPVTTDPPVKTETADPKPVDIQKPPLEPPKAEPKPDTTDYPAPPVKTDTVAHTPAANTTAPPTRDPNFSPEKTSEEPSAKLVVVTEENIPDKPIEIRPRPRTKPAGTTKTATQQQQKALQAMKPLFEPIVITVPKPEADRPRVVAGVETKTDIAPCTVVVSQEKISIPHGRSVAMIVGIDGGDSTDLTGTASSPADIEVTAQPEIAGMEGKKLFMLKSVAALTGVFQVTFRAPCGRKDVVVTIK